MTTYYTYNAETKVLIPAPRTIKTATAFIINPIAEQSAAIGAYPRNDDATPPTPPHGKIAVFDGYALENGKWTAQYRFEPEPPPAPRTFSKLKLGVLLAKEGKWDALVNWLNSQTVNGMNGYAALELAQNISEAHPLFERFFAAAKTALDIDDKKAEAILAAAVLEGV